MQHCCRTLLYNAQKVQHAAHNHNIQPQYTTQFYTSLQIWENTRLENHHHQPIFHVCENSRLGQNPKFRWKFLLRAPLSYVVIPHFFGNFITVLEIFSILLYVGPFKKNHLKMHLIGFELRLTMITMTMNWSLAWAWMTRAYPIFVTGVCQAVVKKILNER